MHSIRFVLILVILVPMLPSQAFFQTDSPEPPDSWRTDAERSGYQRTPRYAETVEFSKKLAASSPLVEFSVIGKSPEGKEIPLLIASSEGDFTPNSARRSGKAVVLVQAAIHAGESDGKDAGLALFRDIAVTGSRRYLLDDAVILFIPIYNVDGHEIFSKYNRINQNGPEEMGFRENSANQNLNRDYVKADNPETRAWLRLWNEWKPDFFIDCHVTDGADYRYNITWEYGRHHEASPPLARWMKDHFEDKVIAEIERDGNLLSPYVQFADRGDPTKGIFTFIATPRFATGYTPLRNRIGLLIEAHSLKGYRSRVIGTYDTLHRLIAEIGRSRASLFEANRAADSIASKIGAGGASRPPFPLRQTLTRESSSFELKGVEIYFRDSLVSGGKRIVYGTEPVDISIPWYDSAAVTKSVVPPSFYVIPPQWTAALELLEIHGIEFERLKEARDLEVESYRFEDAKWADAPFEGRVTVSATTVPVKEIRRFPKGSALVPLGQTSAPLIIHMLEPDAPDSLFYWGFFNAIFETKEYAESYALETLAEEMLANDPALRKEFEERLKDKDFAANQRARLNFFYDRSPFKEIPGRYPVGRIMDDLHR